ncbi:hypothetical protein LIER_44161 [Lithospermum erythrorhizon]|uniref:Uncharacterized protein n=1 Tax=Lithospermum erythrorhizon TaxID=34254 RepID=A0AAV3R4D7_LITER
MRCLTTALLAYTCVIRSHHASMPRVKLLTPQSPLHCKRVQSNRQLRSQSQSLNQPSTFGNVERRNIRALNTPTVMYKGESSKTQGWEINTPQIQVNSQGISKKLASYFKGRRLPCLTTTQNSFELLGKEDNLGEYLAI